MGGLGEGKSKVHRIEGLCLKWSPHHQFKSTYCFPVSSSRKKETQNKRKRGLLGLRDVLVALFYCICLQSILTSCCRVNVFLYNGMKVQPIRLIGMKHDMFQSCHFVAAVPNHVIALGQLHRGKSCRPGCLSPISWLTTSELSLAVMRLCPST